MKFPIVLAIFGLSLTALAESDLEDSLGDVTKASLNIKKRIDGNFKPGDKIYIQDGAVLLPKSVDLHKPFCRMTIARELENGLAPGSYRVMQSRGMPQTSELADPTVGVGFEPNEKKPAPIREFSCFAPNDVLGPLGLTRDKLEPNFGDVMSFSPVGPKWQNPKVSDGVRTKNVTAKKSGASTGQKTHGDSTSDVE
jgi:hypothetical protein